MLLFGHSTPKCVEKERKKKKGKRHMERKRKKHKTPHLRQK
jgi:hypothetical protein